MANKQPDRTPLDGQELHSIEERPVKTSRQLQLWEPHPGKVDEPTRHDDPIQAVETEATPSPSVQEKERQLQWIHRWLEESTQEEIQTQRHEAAARGSSILRSLTVQKKNAINQGRWDHKRASNIELPEDSIQRESLNSTVQGIISWLNWITEQESQKPSPTTLPYRPTEYMQHLQATYEAHISRQDGLQEVLDVTAHQDGTR